MSNRNNSFTANCTIQTIDIKMTFRLKRTINWSDCSHVCRYKCEQMKWMNNV